MTAAIPTRLVLLLGVALAAVAALLVVRTTLLGSEEPAAPTQTFTKPARPAPRPSSPATRRPSIELLAGLPGPLAHELRYEKVVVVSFYTSRAGTDRGAVAQARSGADQVDAGFVAMNVADEQAARAVQSWFGTISSPSVAVVRRPGTIVARFAGWVDSTLVAQAAHNAGAGRA